MKQLASLLLPALLLATACGSSEPVTDAPTTTAPPEAATVAPVPEGFGSITPIIVVKDVDAALAFYGKALGAIPGLTLPGPDGTTMHGEMKIGDSVIMLSAENVERGARSPATAGGTNGSLLVYVPDVDVAVRRAVEAGAAAGMPVANMFWGDRYGQVSDPDGHRWGIATHREDVTSEEMKKRADAWLAAAMKGEQLAAPEVITPAKGFQPEGYKTVTVTLVIKGGAADLGFYTKTLGGTLIDKMPMPDGRLMHASVKIGDSILHLSSEFPQMEPSHKSATNLGASPVSVHHYVINVDAVFAKVISGGATSMVPVSNMFWGDRWGVAVDPSGTEWGIGTHVENLTREQIIERMKKPPVNAK